ncbi:MAG: hypothetical protein WKG32_04580 [Gemmatimonadaceae bacterium]
MSPARRRVGAARAALAGSVVASAALWGLAISLLAWLALSAIAGVAGRSASGLANAPGMRSVVALAAGVAVATAVLRRGRRAWSLEAVALWLEEQVPALRYALVTALDARFAGADPALERAVAAARWERPLRRALARTLLPPLAAVAAAAVLTWVLTPGVAMGRNGERGAPARSAPARATSADAPSRLAPLRASVMPPAYSREPEQTLHEPSTIAALVGARVVLTGRGSAAGIVAAAGDAAAAVAEIGSEWRLELAMPTRAAAIRIRDRRFERIIVLEPRADSVPVTTLTSPPRDTVFRTPGGTLGLTADAQDDIGLSAGWLEFIVSSGEGESFSFRSGTVGRGTFGGSKRGNLRATLSLDALGLKAGDVVHLRAVVRDNNAVSGVSVGYSETRTLRIARLGEYDSVAVEGAPPPEADRSEVSQRMLIMLAEALERRRQSLSRTALTGESGRIARDQARLRRRVGEIIFARLGGEGSAEHAHGDDDAASGAGGRRLTPAELLKAAEAATGSGVGEALDFEGDETPVVAINRPLLEAYNAMWDAERELGVGEPRRALPHMRAALAAIQKARAAERVYLRGRPPAVVVDLDKVRLGGKLENVGAEPRTPRADASSPAAARAARLVAAIGLLVGDPRGASDSLALLRVDAVESAPSLARALGDAIEALRAGRDATAALRSARRAAAGEPASRSQLLRWGGAW